MLKTPDNTANNTVAIAMSGGVDSSVAALLTQEAGHEVFGITAIMTDELSRCCAPEEVDMAGSVCDALGIPHHVVGVQKEFSETVVEYFTREYIAGRTPSPCVRCNRYIKFGALMTKARALGAHGLATGHYARVRMDDRGRARLLRGADRDKDQSYFLGRLTQEQLAAARFPLGEITKQQVKERAAAMNLPSRQSSESQDVCFVMEGTHGEWIDLRSFETNGPGAILDSQGKKLGKHLGVHHYTIGQRKGLGIATGAPVYVTAIDPEKRTLTVGPREEALTPTLRMADVNWILSPPDPRDFRASVQIRYKHTPASARIHAGDDDTWMVEFDKPQFAVTPGQLAAIYDGDEVLGAGWITYV